MRLVEVLRGYLAGGVQAMLRLYPVLQEILETPHGAADWDIGASAVKKGSYQEKQRAQYRRQDRSFRSFQSDAYDIRGDGGAKSALNFSEENGECDDEEEDG